MHEPTNVGANTLAGVLHQMQHRTAEARVNYERALEINPRAAVAGNNLAWIYVEEGRNLDSALQLAQMATSELPQRPEVSDTLAWVYHKKGLSSLAVPPLLESVQKDPKNAIFHYHLGAAYAATRQPAKAREALHRALAIDSSSPAAENVRKLLAPIPGGKS